MNYFQLFDLVMPLPFFGPNINKMKEKGDVEGLIKELGNKDVKVRIDAVKALAELKYTRGLIAALKNDHNEVRIEAILALESIDEPEASDALIDVLYTEEVEAVWLKAFEAVIKTLQAAVTKSSSVMEKAAAMLESIGVELLKSGRDKFALKCFEKAAQISPEKETFGSIGVVLTDYGQHEEALNYFEKCIAMDPNDARGWGGKGIALFRLGRIEEAMNCCKKALEIDPTLKGARDTLGAIYYSKGDLDAMVSLARETLRYAPGDIKAHIMLSEALALSGKLLEAEQVTKEALALLNQMEFLNAEDLSQVHQQLGIIYVMRGYPQKALEEFKEAVRSNSRDQWGYKLLDALSILNMMEKIMEGTPLERRARLLGLAEKRARTYSSLAEWEAEWRE